MTALKKISAENAFSRMAASCSKREYCRSEIMQKLSRYDLSETQKASIIRQLIAEKYIDENRYVRSFIHDKLRFNKWGKVKIRYALLQKAIPQKIIDAAFSEFSDDELLDKLASVLQTKSKSIKYETSLEKRNKLLRFALGRGFEMNDILKCLDKMEQ